MICSNAIRTGVNNYTLPMPGGNLKQIKRMDTRQKVEINEGNDRFNDLSIIIIWFVQEILQMTCWVEMK